MFEQVLRQQSPQPPDGASGSSSCTMQSRDVWYSVLVGMSTDTSLPLKAPFTWPVSFALISNMFSIRVSSTESYSLRSNTCFFGQSTRASSQCSTELSLHFTPHSRVDLGWLLGGLARNRKRNKNRDSKWQTANGADYNERRDKRKRQKPNYSRARWMREWIEFEIEPEAETAQAAAAKPSTSFGAPNAWELIINRCASASRRFARVSVTCSRRPLPAAARHPSELAGFRPSGAPAKPALVGLFICGHSRTSIHACVRW